jgi:hypothetical protein
VLNLIQVIFQILPNVLAELVACLKPASNHHRGLLSVLLWRFMLIQHIRRDFYENRTQKASTAAVLADHRCNDLDVVMAGGHNTGSRHQ